MNARLRLAAGSVRSWLRFLRNSARPWDAQARVWDEISGLIQQSSYWSRECGKGCPPLEQFAPTTIGDYKAALDGALHDTHSPLNGEEIIFWVQTSGSLGFTKYLPMTRTFDRQFARANAIPLPLYLQAYRHQDSRRSLPIAAQMPTENSPAGIPIGYLSYYFLSRAVESGFKYPFPMEVYRDFDTVTEWLPYYALSADLITISGITPGHVLHIFRKIETEGSRLLELLKNDQSPPDPLTRASVSPERLDHLRQVFKSGNGLTLKSVWPNLRHVFAWRGATAGLQSPILERKLGKDVTLVDYPYSATEGPITFPQSVGSMGGPIDPAGIIHEFLRPTDSPTPENVLKAWELEEGETYEILLTTGMGFVRYRLGDYVECTGFVQRTPIIRFRERTGREVNFGHIVLGEADLAESIKRAGWHPEGKWVFAPNSTGNGLVLYLTEEPGNQLRERLDEILGTVNFIYEFRRKLAMMNPLVVEIISESHPVWKELTPRHAQSKPKILIESPLD